MLKKGLTSIALASIASIAPINAEEKGAYFVGSIGSGQMADIDISEELGGGEFEFDSGFSGEFGIGYDFGKFRTQLTINSTNTDLTTVQGEDIDVSIDINSWIISAAYDFRADKKWQPYISAGLGQSNVDVDAGDLGGTNIADQVNISTAKFKLGVNYEASEDFDIYGEVWGQALDDFTIGQQLEFEDCGIAGASIGLRYKL